MDQIRCPDCERANAEKAKMPLQRRAIVACTVFLLGVTPASLVYIAVQLRGMPTSWLSVSCWVGYYPLVMIVLWFNYHVWRDYYQRNVRRLDIFGFPDEAGVWHEHLGLPGVFKCEGTPMRRRYVLTVPAVLVVAWRGWHADNGMIYDGDEAKTYIPVRIVRRDESLRCPVCQYGGRVTDHQFRTSGGLGRSKYGRFCVLYAHHVLLNTLVQTPDGILREWGDAAEDRWGTLARRLIERYINTK